MRKIGLFWPGDARAKLNELALPSITEATLQLERALKKLGRDPYRARRLVGGTTREWPFMAADMGIGRETLMAHYLSNHVAVAYGDVFEETCALSLELGFRLRVLSDE